MQSFTVGLAQNDGHYGFSSSYHRRSSKYRNHGGPHDHNNYSGKRIAWGPVGRDQIRIT